MPVTQVPVVPLAEMLTDILSAHRGVVDNPSRKDLIRAAVERREVLVSAGGALALWTPNDSTGRAPQDTYIVKHGGAVQAVDWTSSNNLPLAPEVFDGLWRDACAALSRQEKIFVTDRVVGADPAYALPVRTVSDRAITALFSDNMFRPAHGHHDDRGAASALASGGGFTLLALPYERVAVQHYAGALRRLPSGKTSDLIVATDMERRLGLVYGSSYCGSCKKLLFTVMNYLLPELGILPLHCAANEAPGGRTAILLGLSGTGKTTLSADSTRALIGDDEHGWSDRGIANFEGGCYAKLIGLDPAKEPEIHQATFGRRPVEEHGAIIENCMVYPDGRFDVQDERLTANSRSSYPLSFLSNVKLEAQGGHPSTILFLTADATGVLPPLSRLNADQAKLWFLMGFTSKLAGTETGIKEPQATFSRFFGGPFMPRHPDDYLRLLGERIARHGTEVFLVNTGWSGGGYGVGQRMDIRLTRAMVRAAWDGQLKGTPCSEDARFHVAIPRGCSGVDSALLDPKRSWKDQAAYEAAAHKLAAQFSAHFDKAYAAAKIPATVRAQCPGK